MIEAIHIARSAIAATGRELFEDPARRAAGRDVSSMQARAGVRARARFEIDAGLNDVAPVIAAYQGLQAPARDPRFRRLRGPRRATARRRQRGTDSLEIDESKAPAIPLAPVMSARIVVTSLDSSAPLDSDGRWAI